MEIPFLLTQEPNIDCPGWVSLLGSSNPSIFWFYLLQVLSDLFIRQVDGDGERRSLYLSVYGSDLEVVNVTVVTFHCPKLWPLGYPQRQGRLGNAGGCVPWREREMTVRTIPQFCH